MPRRLPVSLVGMGSAAIALFWIEGFTLTLPGATPPSQALPPPSPAASAPSTSPVGSPSSRWRDGVYRASGWSRFGDVEVTVAILGGRIARVRLTRVTTYFPASVIEGLPAGVVKQQSANVDLVSGATGSSLAFRAAVQNDLRQAAGQ